MATLMVCVMDCNYTIKYDQYGDVLYVVSEGSRTALRSQYDDADIQWRFTGENLYASGFTILDFNYAWQSRASDLQERIMKYMNFDASISKDFVSNIYEASSGGAKSVAQALGRLGIAV